MFNVSKKSVALTALASLAVAASGSLALKPALARDVAQQIAAAVVTCSNTTACVQWNNNSTGNGVQGQSTGGNGVVGVSAAASRSGVFGGATSTTGGYGVHGSNLTSANGYGVYGLGGPGIAVWANSFGSKPSILSNATSGHAADLFSSKGVGAVISEGSNSSNNVNHVIGEGGNPGAIIGGSSIGEILTAGLNGTPLIVQGISGSGGGEVTIDSTGNINTSGDIIYGGSIIGPSATQTGVTVTSYVTKATQSNIEDSGTGQLVGGTAIVYLDPAYAQSIDVHTPYRVFLTPDADSHGLYIAQKSATAFVVREMQGGHGTYSFDYRILGTALGHTADRMTPFTAALRAQLRNRAH